MSSDSGPIAFAERLITLIDQGRCAATYKYALLLALIDVCRERTSEHGTAPETIHTRDLAYRILELYWPQTAPYVTPEGAIVLRQNSKGQAGIVRAIIDFRERQVPDASTTLSRARKAEPRAFARLVERVERKLIEIRSLACRSSGVGTNRSSMRLARTLK